MSAPAMVEVAVAMPSERRQALVALARSLHRDEADLVNEAVAQLLASQAGRAGHLRAGLEEVEAGDIASAEEVAAAFAASP